MSKPKMIFVVRGGTGEYSDARFWDVAAYVSEALAQEHMRLAQESADAFEKARETQYEDPGEGVNPYDAGMQMSYTGTTYQVYPVELRADIPPAVKVP